MLVAGDCRHPWTLTFRKTEEDMTATEAAADDLRGEAASATGTVRGTV
jgi:hypothetical protein